MPAHVCSVVLSLLYPNSQVTWRDVRGRLKEQTRHLQKRNSFQSVVRLALLKWWKTLLPMSSHCTTTFCAGLDLQAQDTCLETDSCTNWRKHKAGDKAKISLQRDNKAKLCWQRPCTLLRRFNTVRKPFPLSFFCCLLAKISPAPCLRLEFYSWTPCSWYLTQDPGNTAISSDFQDSLPPAAICDLACCRTTADLWDRAVSLYYKNELPGILLPMVSFFSVSQAALFWGLALTWHHFLSKPMS